MKPVFLFLMAMGFLKSSFAQESFVIYSVKGNVMIAQNKKSTKAKIGEMIEAPAQLIIPAKGAVSLICNQTNLITIEKSGTVNLADLKDQCTANTSSVSGNYLKYVWNQLTQKPGSPEKNRKMFMNNVGAASRGINNIWIDQRLDTVNYVAGNFRLSWKSYAEAEEFSFTLYGDKKAKTALYTTNTKNRFINLKDIASLLQEGKTYYWTAAIKGEENKELKVLNVVSKDSYAQLLKAWQDAGPAFENEGARSFRLAFLLEQAHYLSEAYDYYKKATSLQPDMELYKTTLAAFKKDYSII